MHKGEETPLRVLLSHTRPPRGEATRGRAAPETTLSRAILAAAARTHRAIWSPATPIAGPNG